MFIVSLAIADLVVGLIVMPISAIYIFTEDWLFGVAVCQIWIAVDYTASTASIFNLFILSLDRYWSVTSPLRYIRRRTKKRALIMISVVWFASSLWLIPIVGWHQFAHGGERSVPSNICDTEYAKNTVFKIVTAFFNFYLPLAVMYTLYGKIFHEIRKRSEFELGQRNVGGMVANSTTVNTHVAPLEDSDQKNDTFGDDTTPPSLCAEEGTNDNSLKKSAYNVEIQEGELRKSKSGKSGYTAIPLIATKQKSKNKDKSKKGDCQYQVEYVYDENVVDPQTEKVERFFYEDHVALTPHFANVMFNPAALAETSLSAPAPSPSSECSGNNGCRKEERHKTAKSLSETTNTQRPHSRPKETKKKRDHREHEALLKPGGTVTANAALQRRPLRRQESDFNLLRDQKNRRLTTTVFNFKERVRIVKQTSSLSKEIKAARQLGVIMGAFTLCFLPYFILFLVVAFCDGCVEPDLLTAMTWIGYMNSTLNPFLYPLCNANFRRKFRKMLQFGAPLRKRFEPFDRNSFTTANKYD